MQFSERAACCNIVLKQNNPVGFIRNRKGILQYTINAETILKMQGQLSNIGYHPIFYTEQDPSNTTQPEAQLVCMGIWNQKDIGWLWTRLPDDSFCYLAKVTPKESTDLNPGWITEKGLFIIDVDYLKRLREQA